MSNRHPLSFSSSRRTPRCHFVPTRFLRLALSVSLLSLLPASFSAAQQAPTTPATSTPAIRIDDPTLIQPRTYVIQEVVFEGLLTARESYLLSTSGLLVGTVVTIPGQSIANAIRQLYRTGLFSDVKIDYEMVTGGVKILVTVLEQPRLEEYTLEGVKKSQARDLRDRLTLLSGFAVTRSVKAQAVNTIKRYFREEGYWNTSVEIEEELSDDFRNRVSLTFRIDPGQMVKVREIRFEGNETIADAKLRKEFKTIKPDRWWNFFKRHVYVKDLVEEGTENVLTYYRSQGHRDVRVLADSVYLAPWKKEQGVTLAFTLQEGPQYKLRNISFDGNTVYTDERLTEALGFQRGEIFDESKYQENLSFKQDNSDITSLYQNVGYLFFDIRPTVEVAGEDSIDLSFEIIENDIATIREVSFRGNEKTHDEVIRRALRTVPGQTYSRAAIIRTIRELGTLGYFSPEGINPIPYPNVENKTVDIEFELKEAESTDNFEFSGGFGGRQIGVILSARVNFNNFSLARAFEPGGWSPIPSGDGQRFSIGVQVTGRGYQSYSFSFSEPWLRGRPTSLSVSASYDLLDYSTRYFGFSTRNYELFSSSVSIGKKLDWPDDYFIQRTSLSYQLYNVSGFEGVFSQGIANILSLRQSYERNSLDNFISPSAGSKFDLSGELAPPLPGFNQFYKIKSSYQSHVNLVEKLVLSGSAEYGFIGYFGAGEKSNFQRFFLGGTQIQQRQNFINDNVDMRGFPGGLSGVISPLDENQNQIGGRIYSKYSFEMRYPAVANEQLQLIPYLFADAGNAYLDFDSFNPFNLKRATGLGVRIFLPILGLVDLSYGYRLDGTLPSTDGNGLEAKKWEFLFNIGAPF